MGQKMIDDSPGLDPAEAMDACVAAKNCPVNVYGYSPIQLAFGSHGDCPPSTALPAAASSVGRMSGSPLKGRKMLS